MEFLTLLGGVLCAAAGGELFVRGVVGVARWARVSAGIIGATFAAFATSSPELSVAVTSALDGTPEISLGDALGSNVVNIGLVLGVALLFGALHAPRDAVKRDFPVALLVPVLIGLLAYDGTLSRMDGVLLLAVFFVWLGIVLVEVRRQRSSAGTVLGEKSPGRAWLESGIGLALLVLAGILIVAGAQDIAASFGVDLFVVGVILVAIGTSAPEIAVTLIARWRGHDEVGLGTVIGSNIFNGLFIVAVAALITPVAVTQQAVMLTLLIGLLTTAAVVPFDGKSVSRRQGVVLVSLYVFYIAAILENS